MQLDEKIRLTKTKEELHNLIGYRTTVERDLKQFLVCYHCYVMYEFVSRFYIRGDGLLPAIAQDSET